MSSLESLLNLGQMVEGEISGGDEELEGEEGGLHPSLPPDLALLGETGGAQDPLLLSVWAGGGSRGGGGCAGRREGGEGGGGGREEPSE